MLVGTLARYSYMTIKVVTKYKYVLFIYKYVLNPKKKKKKTELWDKVQNKKWCKILTRHNKEKYRCEN